VSRIATGTGDKGQTGLFNGSRVAKSHPSIKAFGDVDELDAALGVAASSTISKRVRGEIATLQRELFTLKADLATPVSGSKAVRRIGPPDVKRLEARIDALEEALPPLKQFIANSGTPLAAHLQFARAVARRAERSAWEAHSAVGGLNLDALVYLNRLSDFLFLMARQANLDAGVAEEIMKPLD